MRHKTEKQVFAKRSLGQNFLSDPNYIQKIVDALRLQATDTVMEIGCGRGALTDLLVERAGKVIGIEFDRDLTPLLAARYAGRTTFNLINEDVLSVDLTNAAAGDIVKLAANLPYNISTAVLQHLIVHKQTFSEMVLMFQREVVERITARPGSKDRGYLTVLAEANFTAIKLFDVPGTAFRPVPKVWSSVVRLAPKDIEIPENFEKIISLAFRQKRKTLVNNLKNEIGAIQQHLRELNIGVDRRAETLKLDEWLDLARACA